MMRICSVIKSLSVIVLVMAAYQAGVYGQVDAAKSERDRSEIDRKQTMGRWDGFEDKLNGSKATPLNAERAEQRRRIGLTPAEKRMLKPAPEDVKDNAAFLRQHETGIFRLLPGGMYESGQVVSVDVLANRRPQVAIKGGGAYYSFTKSRHDLDEWSEIGLRNNLLQAVVSEQSLGLMAMAGDTPLDSITLDSPAVSYLAKLTPPSDYSGAEEQFKRNHSGFKNGDFTYRSFLPARVKTSYVLRAINYQRADVLLAFRVIRQDSDGSLTILWKRLKTYQPPVLKEKTKSR